MGVLFAVLSVPARLVFIFVALASVSFIAFARVHSGDIPYDPFAPYADLLSPQPANALLGRGFHCPSNGAVPIQLPCTLKLNNGAFSQIEASVVSGMSRKVVFRPGENSLTLGDLVMLWGKPDVAVYGSTVNLRWRDRRIVAIPQTYSRYPDYRLPIIYVGFDI